ncbi:MAG: hypothetical protein JW987_01430, partial [Anaerolineaceae bacterium]|nr:hypothetical protein [Anaerolineaceae bacterium]
MKQKYLSTKLHGSAWAGPIIALMLLVASITPASAVIGVLERVSVNGAGAQATGASTYPSISADTCLIAFESTAADLVAGDTNGAVSDVFVRNRCTGSTDTILVSINADGDGSGNGASESPVISADGNFVAFRSAASDLVAVDTNGDADIFIRNLTTNSTTLVSVDSNEAQANNEAFAPSISANGQFVTFFSYATNLAPDACDCFDVFVRDVTAGTTELVSVDSNEAQGSRIPPEENQSTYCSISGDGRYVAFQSLAALVIEDTNGLPDIYVRDRTDGTTIRASVSTSGAQGAGDSYLPSISSTGQFVAFESSAHAFAPETDDNSSVDIFVRDILTSTTVRASLNNSGANEVGHSTQASISANGRYVAFSSYADLINPDNPEMTSPHIYVRDLTSGVTTRISVDSGSNLGNAESSHPALSAEGRYLAFQSVATNLVSGDTNAASDIFYADSINVEDVTAPGITSFTRQTPSSEDTNATTLTFRATFDEPVQNVDAGDFTATGVSGVSIAVDPASGPATVYDITLSGGDLADYNGIVGLDFSTTPIITDLASNSFVNAEPTMDQTYNVDHIVPDVTINDPRPPLYTSVDSATFYFSSTDPTATFICSFNDLTYSPCTSGTNYPGLGENTWIFYVKAVDLAGNITASPATYTWEIDWTAPYALSFARSSPTDNPTNADSLIFRVDFDDDVTGVGPEDFASTASGATVSDFSSSAASIYYVTVSGGDLGIYNGEVGLTYSDTPTIDDQAGNDLSTTLPTGDAYETYLIDNYAPTVVLTGYPPLLSNSTSAEFIFSSPDGGTVFTCSQNGTLYTSCASPVTLDSLSEGPHSFYIRATDPADNLGAPTQHDWTVDTVAPVVNISSGPIDPTNDTGGEIAFTNSDGTATLTCLLDGLSQATCPTPFPLSDLDEGEHTFTVTATDAASNAGTDSHVWFIDTTDPNTTINTNPADPSNVTSPTFAFSGTDNHTDSANL